MCKTTNFEATVTAPDTSVAAVVAPAVVVAPAAPGQAAFGGANERGDWVSSQGWSRG